MIKSEKVILRDKSTEDAWNDYAWESDPELSRLDAAPVLKMSYADYLEEYTSELFIYYTEGRRFAIDTHDGIHIGNCSYYNYNEFRGDTEIGIMIGDRDYWGKGYGTDAVTTLVDHVFTNTDLNRIYLKTLNWNDRAQKSFAKCGFSKFGEMSRAGYDFILMEIHRDEWLKSKAEKDTRENNS